MKIRKYKDASDRLTIAIENMPSITYRFVRWQLCRKFGLKKSGEYTTGLDEKFQEFSSADGTVSIEWDIWSGFTVTALDSDSEVLVEKVGVWLKDKYED